MEGRGGEKERERRWGGRARGRKEGRRETTKRDSERTAKRQWSCMWRGETEVLYHHQLLDPPPPIHHRPSPPSAHPASRPRRFIQIPAPPSCCQNSAYTLRLGSSSRPGSSLPHCPSRTPSSKHVALRHRCIPCPTQMDSGSSTPRA